MSPNNLMHLATIAVKKQFFFLIGTGCLAYAWYLENVSTDKFKEDLEYQQEHRQNYYHHMDNIESEQFQALMLQAHYSSFPNKFYLEDVNLTLTSLAVSTSGILLESEYILHGKDTTMASPWQTFNTQLKNIRSLEKSKDTARLMSLIADMKATDSGESLIVQNASINNIRGLSEKSKVDHKLSLLFLIIGTFLISLNKAREFILHTGDNSTSVEARQ